MDAIQWKGNTLYLLDQTKLPVEEVWLSYTDYRPVIDAIRTMVVRLSLIHISTMWKPAALFRRLDTARPMPAGSGH